MVFSKPIFTTTIIVQKWGNHSTLGLELKQIAKTIIITTCVSGTPAARIHKWRQILKGAAIHSVDGKLTSTILEIKNIIAKIKPGTDMVLQVIPINPTNIHPETGIPQINFDQFIHLCHTHQELIENATSVHYYNEIDDASRIQVHKLDTLALTRTKLMKQDDWKDWEASEFLQLDQYERQKMFSEPGPLPSISVNILPMIWVYLVKTDG